MSDAETYPTQEQLDRYAEQFNQSLTLKFFGARMSFPKGEKVVVSMEILPEHRGGLGSDAVNGGIISAIFDLAIGSTSALRDPTRRSATVQLSTSFERPLRGATLRAEATIDTLGATTLFASARMYDDQGVACARCQGVVQLSRMKWASGDSPAVN